MQDIMAKKFKKITPIPGICHIQMLCSLLESLIIPSNFPSDAPKELYETYFVFCVIWSYGSALYHDGQMDHRSEFSKWFMNEFKTVKFPSNSSVFDVWVDPISMEFASWLDRVPKFELDSDLPLQVLSNY